MSLHPANQSLTVFAALIVFVLPLESHAHEGETHESGAATQPAVVSDIPVGWSGRGDIFEVVVKALPFYPDEQALFTAYVVEGASNKPVAGAKVSASISLGKSSTRAEFAETTASLPGAYTARLRFPDASPHSMLFDISLDSADDLVAVDGVRAQAASAMAASASPARRAGNRIYAAWAVGAGLCVVIVIGSVIVILRRRQKSGGIGGS